MPGNIASFNYLKPHLDKHITSIGGLEIPLYSDKLKTAGRADCLCKWDGEWAILDFKTSRREKKREDIGGYFMQSSAYAYMVYELLGIYPRKIVIAMTIDVSPAKIFEERSVDWLGKFVELRNSVDI
jgi:genome maintenance exonuclease 1